MNSFGAYEDEMGRFLKLGDEELARLLAGEAAVGSKAFEEVASLLTEARSTFATAPDAATRARHIAAISEASQLLAENGNPAVRSVSKAHGPVGAQVSELPKWRRVMDRTVSVALKALAGTVAASLSMVGLAYAGVDLPGRAAEQAFEAVTGVELPNQGEADTLPDDLPEDARADEVRAVIDGWLGTKGCEFGQAVATAASGSDPTPDKDPCTAGKEGEATGAEKSAEGRARAEDAQSNNPTGKGAGAEKSAEGRARAEEGQSNNPTDRP
jgi:hypothetical protein